MTNDDLKALQKDPDGLLTYEYIANHIDSADSDMPTLVDNMINVDKTGQFTASAARYLYAIDSEKHADSINRLVAATIDRDRERRYIGDLLEAIWGKDYKDHADQLRVTDDNFRRIYKRLHPTGI